MKHARADYNRIQDLAEVMQYLRQQVDDGEIPSELFFHQLEDILEERYGPLKVPPIPMDEPVFLLRAKDIVAPSVVRTWATSAYSSGANDLITATAREHADLMEKWQDEHSYQIPDMPDIP
jgi:hypothetical protein